MATALEEATKLEEPTLEQAGVVVDEEALKPTGTVFAPEEVEPPVQVEPVSAVTSDIARIETDKNLALLEDEARKQADLELKQAEAEPLAVTQVEREKTVVLEAKKEDQIEKGALTREEFETMFPVETRAEDAPGTFGSFDPETGLFVFDVRLPGDVTPTKTFTPEETQILADTREVDKELDKVDKQLDELIVRSSELNKRLIQDIKDRFAERRIVLKDINKRSLASFRQFGFRSGAIRRAFSFTGILSAEEDAGFQRLTNLKAQESSLINQAERAALQQEFELLSQKRQAILDNRKAQEEAQSKLNADSIKQQELILKQDKNARDEEEALRKQEKFILENTALTILNALTGDEAQDSALIAGFAAQEGVDPNRLLNEVLKQQTIKQKADFDLESARLGITQKQFNIAETKLNIAKKQQELNQKLSREGFETLSTKDALRTNRSIAKTDAFKAIRKGQDSLQFLLDFEKAFIAQGADLEFIGEEAGILQTKYRAAILNLKEFFNLGVLNGPDLDILEQILPNPGSPLLVFRGGGATVTAGIASMKNQLLTTVQDRSISIKNEFSNFDPEQLTNLKEVDRLTKLIEDQVGGTEEAGNNETDLGGGGFIGEAATQDEQDFLDSI